MKLEVLVSTMFLKNHDLIEKMKIDTDAIIINQCDKFEYDEINSKKGNKIRIYSLNERGIGLSRNTALMRADSDIILFADDDEILNNKYKQEIVNAFKNNPKADMIIFNIDSTNSNRKTYRIKTIKRVHKYNCLRYGTVRLAVRTDKVRKRNITFSLLFGGGAKYGSGEDSLFIYECLKKKLKIYTCPISIATVDFSNSSWFNGYNEKFFYDKGALFTAINLKLSYFFILQFLIRKSKTTGDNFTILEKYRFMVRGRYDFIKCKLDKKVR